MIGLVQYFTSSVFKQIFKNICTIFLNYCVGKLIQTDGQKKTDGRTQARTIPLQPSGWKGKNSIYAQRNSKRFQLWAHKPIVKRVTGPWFNIKMSSYQYRKSHCGDKTILQPSYLHNGISYTGKMISLYWIRALVIHSSHLTESGFKATWTLPSCPFQVSISKENVAEG